MPGGGFMDDDIEPQEDELSDGESWDKGRAFFTYSPHPSPIDYAKALGIKPDEIEHVEENQVKHYINRNEGIFLSIEKVKPFLYKVSTPNMGNTFSKWTDQAGKKENIHKAWLPPEYMETAKHEFSDKYKFEISE